MPDITLLFLIYGVGACAPAFGVVVSGVVGPGVGSGVGAGAFAAAITACACVTAA